ncbi:MAG: hypothetical protein FJX32_16220 [Alphaproteobacteria bacterium]|nr:hypothetical protein [Alphaproteobacteria bacterium]
MSSGAQDWSGQEPWDQPPSAEEKARFEQLHDALLRGQGSLGGQQRQLWVCIQAMQSLAAAVVQALANEPASLQQRRLGRRQVFNELRALQAWLLSVELLLERTGEVEWPEAVERLALQLVGELAPDPRCERRLRLNQLLERSRADG